jgi:hypothetical protein
MRRFSPWLLLPVLSAALLLFLVTGPLKDVDIYWHILLGQDILENGRFTGDPAWVAFGNPDWVTTQPLSEILMAWAHQLAGWPGIAAMANVGFAATVTIIVWQLHRVPGWLPAQAIMATGLAVAVATDLQERPTAWSTPGVAITGWIAYQILEHTQRKQWYTLSWWLIPFTIVWANMHGYWMLLPATLIAGTVVAAIMFRQVPSPRPESTPT